MAASTSHVLHPTRISQFTVFGCASDRFTLAFLKYITGVSERVEINQPHGEYCQVALNRQFCTVKLDTRSHVLCCTEERFQRIGRSGLTPQSSEETLEEGETPFSPIKVTFTLNQDCFLVVATRIFWQSVSDNEVHGAIRALHQRGLGPEEMSASLQELSSGSVVVAWVQLPIKKYPEIETSLTPPFYIPAYDERRYCMHDDVAGVLERQLQRAIKEGKGQRRFEFGVDLEVDISSFCDETIDEPGVGVAEAQGERNEMEDVHFVRRIGEALCVGVCDGHGDQKKAGEHVRDHLAEGLEPLLELDDLRDFTDGITALMIDLNQQIIDEGLGGTTLACALVHGEWIYFINVGDSRIVQLTDDGAFQVTEDASLKNTHYRALVCSNGQKIVDGRVNGRLNLACDLGEPSLCPRPTITRRPLEPCTLVVACDGLWEVLDPQTLFYNWRLMEGKTASEMAGYLVEGALFHGTTDNVTVAVVQLEGRLSVLDSSDYTPA